MAVDIAGVANIAAREITVATDREIDPCHVISFLANDSEPTPHRELSPCKEALANMFSPIMMSLSNYRDNVLDLFFRAKSWTSRQK